MTIKEIEARSGMTRANIRYYEQEGLLSPQRGENGYRNYSEGDLDTLLRIKLLRSLGLSIDDIRALQSGELSLSAALSRRLDELDTLRQDTDYALSLCHTLRDDGADYATLDAEKYLSFLPEKNSRDRFDTANDKLPRIAKPWRRYFARTFDIALYSLLWELLLGLVFHVNLLRLNSFYDYFVSFFAYIIMLVTEPLLLHLFGTTPGKWIFGLRLEDENGGRPTYSAGFQRTLSVIWRGMGWFIPIYSIIRLVKSHIQCSNDEPMPWDTELVYTIKDTRTYRACIYVAAEALVIFCSFVGLAAAQLPPNRGDMTVAQFAENYNYLSDFLYEDDYLSPRLDEEGRWAENNLPGSVIIVDILEDDGEKPEFSYIVENGILTSVSMSEEISNTGNWVSPPISDIEIAILAFAGAREGLDLLSVRLRDLDALVTDEIFNGFSFTKGGVDITCDVQYSGFRENSAAMWLFPVNGKENHYALDFNMTLQKQS